MKKFALLFPCIFLASLVSATCLNSNDDYAIELVLNKPDTSYNLFLLQNSPNVKIQGNQYIMQSDYSPNLATIISEKSGLTSGLPTGLSIKIQMPVIAEEKNLPYLKFSSSSAKGIIGIKTGNYNGWKILCIPGTPVPACEFTKGKIKISTDLIGSENYEITTEVFESLEQCETSCEGKCIGARCISKTLKKDIEGILKYAGLVSNFDELFSSYKMLNVGHITITELKPETIQSIDWGEAMRQELVRLEKEGIISISHADIEEISNLAKQGTAGQNYRVVYGENETGKESWLYYYETQSPTLTQILTCNTFTLPKFSFINFPEQQMSPYYLIPIIFTIFFIFLFTILIITARLIDKRQNRKQKKAEVKG